MLVLNTKFFLSSPRKYFDNIKPKFGNCTFLANDFIGKKLMQKKRPLNCTKVI